MTGMQRGTLSLVAISLVATVALVTAAAPIAAFVWGGPQAAYAQDEDDPALLAAATEVYEDWAQMNGQPYRNVEMIVEENDDYFALVRVDAEYSSGRNAPWVGDSVWIECSHVGDNWFCELPSGPTPVPTATSTPWPTPTLVPTPPPFRLPPTGLTIHMPDGGYEHLWGGGEERLAAWPLMGLGIYDITSPTIAVYLDFEKEGIELTERYPGLGVDFANSCPTITAFPAGSNAELAGLQAGDGILAIDDRLFSCTDIAANFFAYQPGDVVTILLARNRETITLEMALAPSFAYLVPTTTERRVFTEEGITRYLYELLPTEALHRGRVYCIVIPDVTTSASQNPRWCFGVSLEIEGNLIDNEPVTGYIGSWSEARWHFSGEEGDFVSIAVTADKALRELRLNGSAQRLVVTGEWVDDSKQFMPVVRLPSSGEYTVVIQGERDTLYDLSLNFIPVEGELQLNEPVLGEFIPGAVQLYAIEGVAGAAVGIRADGDEFIPRMKLIDEQNLITGRGTGAVFYPMFDTSGTHYLAIYERSEAEDALEDMAAYTLTVTVNGTIADGAQGTLRAEEPVLDEITHVIGDLWAFRGEQGDRVAISLSSPEDVSLRLYDSESEWFSSDVGSGIGTDALIRWISLPADGIYTVVANSFSTVDTPYTLTLSFLNFDAPSQDDVVNSSRSLSGHVDDPLGHQYFIDGEDAALVQLSLTTDIVDNSLSVLDAEGVAIPFNTEGTRVFAPSAPGLYSILVSTYNGEPFDYELDVEFLDEVAPQGELAHGVTESEQLAPNSAHRWMLDGKAGDQPWLSLYAEGFLPTVELLGPNHYLHTIPLSAAAEEHYLAPELPVDGEYTIVVTADEDGGTYDLVYDSAQIAGGRFQGTLFPQQEIQGHADSSDGHLWVFVGRQGERVTISLTGGEYPELTLGDSQNNRLSYEDSYESNVKIIGYELPHTGFFVVTVAQSFGGGWDYTLRLDIEEPSE